MNVPDWLPEHILRDVHRKAHARSTMNVPDWLPEHILRDVHR